jgi:hypothetical protein
MVRQWFVNGEKPWEPGIYNVSCRKQNQTGTWYAYWDGSAWSKANRGIDDVNVKSIPSRHDIWHAEGSWRGLAADPITSSAAPAP